MQNESLHLQAARKAASILDEGGFEAFIIGGAVRDLLLGINPKDYDLTTNARPEQIASLSGFKKSNFKDSAQAFGVSRVVVEVQSSDESTHDIDLEIATYREDIEAHLGRKATKIKFATLSDDIARRDFTINALALDPQSNQVLDEVGGLDDINAKIIRFIGSPSKRIQEDPLRVLRGIRLRNQLNFNYEDEARQALVSAIESGVLKEIAPERIKTELTRMLMHPSRRAALLDLDTLGALKVLLPELTALKGVAQPPQLHAEGDAFTHTLLAMDALPDIVSPRLAWATLLHDVGKKTTARSQQETGDRIRFSDHHAEGSKTARQILERLRFGNRTIKDVAWMIHYHIGVDDLPSMRPRRAEQFMSNPAFGDLLELHKADAHAAWSINEDGSIDDGPADFSELLSLWEAQQKKAKQRAPSLKADLGIDGVWAQKNLNLPPGRKLGTLLEALEHAYLDHEISTPEEAARFAQEWSRDK